MILGEGSFLRARYPRRSTDLIKDPYPLRTLHQVYPSTAVMHAHMCAMQGYLAHQETYPPRGPP